MRSFVGQNGIEFSLGHRHFIDAQPGSDVLRKEHPCFGMTALVPGFEFAQVMLVLLFKLFDRDLLGDGDGRQGRGFRLCHLLLKKRQTLGQAAFPERPT